MTLATIGERGRAVFNAGLVDLIEREDVPRTLKMAWNEQVESLLDRS